MIRLSWIPQTTDAIPSNPAEIISGLKEIRIYRAPLTSKEFVLVATLPPHVGEWTTTDYDDGIYRVQVVDNAGNLSQVQEVAYPLSDITPPNPVGGLSLEFVVTPPPQEPPTPTGDIAIVNSVIEDLNGADYTITNNDPGYATDISYADDTTSGQYVALTTLTPGVTSGRLNKSWVQGTHTFVCIRATQLGQTTEQLCRPLSGLWAPGTGQAVLTWDANTEPDLAGYKIYMKNSAAGPYSTPHVVLVGPTTTYTVTNLSPGTYWFRITAYDTSGNESAFSNEVQKTIT